MRQRNINGGNETKLASGIRNLTGMTIHPITQDIYVICNERNRSFGHDEDFVTEFLEDLYGPTTFGRPVELLVLKDESLIFTDDGYHRIYQVHYSNNTYCLNLMSIIFIVACNFLSLYSLLLYEPKSNATAR